MVFLKAPVPGKAKTRLGEMVGMRKAAAVYKRLSEGTMKTVGQLAMEGAHPVLWCDPPGQLMRFRRWLGDGYRYRCQPRGDLGERMALAFRDAFRKNADRVLVIGTDCPGLSPDILRRAFKLLDKRPVVIGPAMDGGYYLLGLRKMNPELFRDIPWSTERVLSATLSKTRHMGLQVACLPVLRDVDTEGDLRWLTGKGG